ncbi:hypothetical protein RB195_024754 [Necator americanus]|uniref:Reverse transcriptase domain-containing protein n=1 Tax=Necator americanus TaxID=51031 RepID=A0ABR1ERL8_NECAM
MPLCLTFIDLKKPFDTIETEAVIEALDNQGVRTPYIKILRELYSKSTTKISPFYTDVIIDVKRGLRQGDAISPKIFSGILKNAMRVLHQPGGMLAGFNETCNKIGLQLNIGKTMFMRNGLVCDAPFSLNGKNISECSSYVYLGREINMMNGLTLEQGRRKRAAWGAYKSIEDVVKKTRNTRLRAHLFDTTVLSALTYAL